MERRGWCAGGAVGVDQREAGIDNDLRRGRKGWFRGRFGSDFGLDRRRREYFVREGAAREGQRGETERKTGNAAPERHSYLVWRGVSGSDFLVQPGEVDEVIAV